MAMANISRQEYTFPVLAANRFQGPLFMNNTIIADKDYAS